MEDEQQQESEARELTCFVISPIGSALAPVGTAANVTYENSVQMWESVFEPACNEFGLKPLRADKLAQPGEITEQIFVLLRDADVVIADVTGGNPNVMYELGLRHTRDKLTIQLGEYEKLPFDVNTIRTIQFKRSEAGRIDARQRLIEVLRAGLAGDGTPVTATRVWTEVSPVSSEAIALAVAKSTAPEAGETEVDEPGFIEILAEGEEAIEKSTQVMTAIAATMDELGTISADVGTRISESDANNKGFAGRLRVARELAAELATPSAELEQQGEEFLSHVSSMDDMIKYITLRASDDLEEREGAKDFFDVILNVADSAEESSVGITEMMHAARELRHISRDLVEPSKTIERALNRILQGIGVVTSWRGLIEALNEDERTA